MKKLIGLIAVLFLLGACHKDLSDDIVKEDNNDDIPSLADSHFLYNTTSEAGISVEFFNTQKNPVSNVYTEIYFENPRIEDEDGFVSFREDLTPVYKGMSNEQGILNTRLSIPTRVKKLYVRPFKPGFVELKEVDVNSEELSVIFGLETVDTSRTTAASKKALADYLTLGEFNNVGYPFYKLDESDVFDDTFLDDVNASLPEQKSLSNSHPDYFQDGLVSDIIITEDAEVFLTFVHEGAGWMNLLGYFHYPTDTPPASPDEVENKIVAFPNVSLAGSGGALQPGNKIQLKYYNPDNQEFSTTFPAGTTISWFLNANGWKGYISDGTYSVYSQDELNTFITDDQTKHVVVLHDAQRELFLIAFEDWRRDDSNSDQDFNDAVFYVESNPITAIEDDNFAPIDTPDDQDGDGVSDLFDDFPTDPELAYKNTYPADDYGTLAFEDLWPHRGDYDFNDLVINYQFDHFLNPSNEIVFIEGRLVPRAIGAGFHNGFGFSLNTYANRISEVSGQILFRDFISLDGNGTERGNSKATIIAFDDAWGLFGFPGVTDFINTTPGTAYFEPDTMKLSIGFSSARNIEETGIPPYNPFIFVNRERSHEVHLPGYEPTQLADTELLGTGHDSSNPETGEYYVSSGNLPWALNLPSSFDYPEEKVSILNAYTYFEAWAGSDGENFPDWYINNSGYRNESLIYVVPE